MSRVVDANLVEVPVPDVVEQAPNNVTFAFNNLVLRPEVPRGKPGEFLEEAQNFVEIGLDCGHVFRGAMQALDNFISAAQSIQQVAKEHTVATVLGQVSEKFWQAEMIANQLHIVDHPSEQLDFGFLVDWVDEHFVALDLQSLHLLHNSFDLVRVVAFHRRVFRV